MPLAPENFPSKFSELASIIGRKLTAYIGGVGDVCVIEDRVCLALHIAKILALKEHPRVIQAWFTGVNPELNDCVPVRLLRESEIDEVKGKLVGSARSFLSGG